MKAKPEKTRKGGREFTSTVKEEVLTEVARLDRMGYQQRDIAEAVGVTQTTVHRYLKVIRDRYVEEQVTDRKALVARKLAEYRDLRLEAWKAYERSKQDAERESEEWGLRSVKKDSDVDKDGEEVQSASARNRGTKRGESGSSAKKISPGKSIPQLIKVKATKMRQGRLPGVEYLRLIADTYKAEREMLGLDEAIKLDVKAQVLDWKVFTLDLGHTSVVEHKMQEALNQLPPQELLDVDAMKNGGWEK